jgi:hypothetical protein
MGQMMPPPSVLPPGLQDNPDAVWHRMLNDAEDSGNPDHVITLMPLMASAQERRQREAKWQGLTKAGIKPQQVADPDERLLMDSYLSAGNKHGYAREVQRMHRAQDLVSAQNPHGPAAAPQATQPQGAPQ